MYGRRIGGIRTLDAEIAVIDQRIAGIGIRTGEGQFAYAGLGQAKVVAISIKYSSGTARDVAECVIRTEKLVVSVDATLASRQNPVVVYARLDMNNAAFHAGDSFDHKDAPFRLKVLKRNASGSYSIDLQLKD